MDPRRLVRRRRLLRPPARLRVACFGAIAALALTMPEIAVAHPSPPLPRQVRLRAFLDGAQVVRPEGFRPPDLGSGSAATGIADLTIDTATGEFQFALEVEGIDPNTLDNTVGENFTAIHVHLGTPETVGPFLIDVHHFARVDAQDANGLVPTGNGFSLTASGVVDQEQGLVNVGFARPEIISFLRSQTAYVTIHTTRNSLFRAGEIRGALEVIPRVLRASATLDGAQVVRADELRPPTLGSGSTNSGQGSLRLHTDSGFFSFSLDLYGISPSALDASHGPNLSGIHLRRGNTGERGEILLDLHHLARTEGSIVRMPDGLRLEVEGAYSARQGALETGVSLAALIDALRKENAYVAVRTDTEAAFRQDELRGNLLLTPDLVRLESVADGAQVVRPPIFQPPVFDTESEATGQTTLVINKDTGQFEFDLSVEGIAPGNLDNNGGNNFTAVQVHWGTPDLRGPILLDVHHYARPPGTLPGGTYGEQEPPTEPDVPGADVFDGINEEIDGFSLQASGFITRQQGAQDVGWTFEQILNFLRSGEGYLSVHTAGSMLFRAGEIRGNLAVTDDSLLVDEVRLTATLTGANVVRPPEFRPPLLGTETTATGAVELTLRPLERRFSARVEVVGIRVADFDENHGGNFTALQVHRGDPISSGPVILDLHLFAKRNIPGLNEIIETEDGFLLLADGTIEQVQARHDTGLAPQEIMDLILSGEAFVGVHTVNLPDPLLFLDGELRGQLRVAEPSTATPTFLRGDCDGDGRVTGLVTDVVFLLNHSFSGGPAPPCIAACDVDGDGTVLGTVTDAVYLLTFNFLGGPPPVAPFPACGAGAGELGCENPGCP